jgi:hypothetical protein
LGLVGKSGLPGHLVVPRDDRVASELDLRAILAEDRGHSVAEDLGGLAARQIEAVSDRRRCRPGVRPRLAGQKYGGRQRHRQPERVTRSPAGE